MYWVESVQQWRTIRWFSIFRASNGCKSHGWGKIIVTKIFALKHFLFLSFSAWFSFCESRIAKYSYNLISQFPSQRNFPDGILLFAIRWWLFFFIICIEMFRFCYTSCQRCVRLMYQRIETSLWMLYIRSIHFCWVRFVLLFRHFCMYVFGYAHNVDMEFSYIEDDALFLNGISSKVLLQKQKSLK